jgi:lipoprotein-releasing system permease protein
MFIMTLTFLNLVVVGGILVGLPEGARLAYTNEYSGDVIIHTLPSKDYIEQSQMILSTLESMAEVEHISPRYVASAKAESNYKTRIGQGEKANVVNALVAGVDPEKEELVTSISGKMLDGKFLDGTKGDVVLGKNLVEKYAVSAGVYSSLVLKDVEVGSKIRLTINGNTHEYRVKGIISGKIQEISTRMFLDDDELRQLMGRTNQNVDEIAVKLVSKTSSEQVVDGLTKLGFDKLALVQTSRQSQGSFLDDIATTFILLSNVIGGIGILVASITIFIVIFINAVTRRKYIGILKGIGISGSAIEMSYVFQSLFYGVVGSCIGLTVVYLILKPYFLLHPINFPFADGLLLVPVPETLLRAGILLIITVIAGYVPARMIIGRNTLDAILGR